jgi:hypothetical protein
MPTCRVRLILWCTATAILLALIAVVTAIDRRERRRTAVAIAKAEAAYPAARLAREVAQAAAKA